MTRSVARRSRRLRHCHCCGYSILLGEVYVQSVASPDHDDLGNPGWWRLDSCSDCAKTYGHTDLIAAHPATRSAAGIAS